MAVSLGKSGQPGPREPRNAYEACPPAPASDPGVLAVSDVTGYINDADLLRRSASQNVSPELMVRIMHLFDTFDVPRPTLDPTLDFEHILAELLAAFNGSEEDVQSFLCCLLVILAPLPAMPFPLNWDSKRNGRYDLAPMGPVFAPGMLVADAAVNVDAISVLRNKPGSVKAMGTYLSPGFSALIALHGAGPLVHDGSSGTENPIPANDAGAKLVERITSHIPPSPASEDFNGPDTPPAI